MLEEAANEHRLELDLGGPIVETRIFGRITRRGWPGCAVSWVRLAWVSLALVFVILGAIDLDLGPAEARLGRRPAKKLGPLGQVFGYWAPTCGRPKSSQSCSVGSNRWVGRARRPSRWPAALAGNHRRLDAGSPDVAGARDPCRGSVRDLLVRQPGADRSIGGDRAGFRSWAWPRWQRSTAIFTRIRPGRRIWAALAFLAGGWPPLVVMGLAIIAIGQDVGFFSRRLLLAAMLTAIALVLLADLVSSDRRSGRPRSRCR